MQWTQQLAVALLNVLWVAFFLSPDPFSVFVQRRSTNEDIQIGEFCIHVPAATVPSNKSNSTNTTFQDHTVQPSPAPGSEPTKMDWDELELTTPGSLPEGGLTASASPLEPGQTSTDDTSSFELAPTKLLRDNEINKPLKNKVVMSCCLAVSHTRIPIRHIRGYAIQQSLKCPIKAIVFVTIRGRHFCADPDAPWVKSVLRTLDRREKNLGNVINDEMMRG